MFYSVVETVLCSVISEQISITTELSQEKAFILKTQDQMLCTDIVLLFMTELMVLYLDREWTYMYFRNFNLLT